MSVIRYDSICVEDQASAAERNRENKCKGDFETQTPTPLDWMGDDNCEEDYFFTQEELSDYEDEVLARLASMYPGVEEIDTVSSTLEQNESELRTSDEADLMLHAHLKAKDGETYAVKFQAYQKLVSDVWSEMVSLDPNLRFLFTSEEFRHLSMIVFQARVDAIVGDEMGFRMDEIVEFCPGKFQVFRPLWSILDGLGIVEVEEQSLIPVLEDYGVENGSGPSIDFEVSWDKVELSRAVAPNDATIEPESELFQEMAYHRVAEQAKADLKDIEVELSLGKTSITKRCRRYLEVERYDAFERLAMVTDFYVRQQDDRSEDGRRVRLVLREQELLRRLKVKKKGRFVYDEMLFLRYYKFVSRAKKYWIFVDLDFCSDHGNRSWLMGVTYNGLGYYTVTTLCNSWSEEEFQLGFLLQANVGCYRTNQVKYIGQFTDLDYVDIRRKWLTSGLR
jgi:hypothetical protein